MNSENEMVRNGVAQKVTAVGSIITEKVKILKPKNMACNVHKEESKDNILENLINMNGYLIMADDINLLSVTDGITRLPLSTLNCDQRLLPFVYFNSF